ncbi:MAG: FMN-dependent NADH-azoreductase [Burkholderiales bacterium]|jgi:FMN-dependent NADH-azoreductase
MATLLHINSSVRNEGSISRQLTAEFLGKWKAAEPGVNIVERDLAANPLPHLNEETLGAFFTPPEKRTPEQVRAAELSDQLVAELAAADVVVIGAPMYNFSVSSGLKAWIDHVARAGLTFKYTESGPVGLLQNKVVYVFTSRGGVYSEGPAKAMDFHETYLRGVLGFIGLINITFVHTEGLAMGEDAVAKAVSQTREAIDTLVA